MPLGNGDISLNVWVESSGDLVFYLGKADSWEDNSRLAKLGRVRVRLSPALPTGSGFVQTLDPSKGEITVTAGSSTTLRVWVDANHPVAHVEVDSASPVSAEASFELWRTAQTTIASESSDINFNNPAGTAQVVEPDTVLDSITDGVGWYHRNPRSYGPNETMQFQDLQAAPTFSDIILGRTFGAYIRSAGATRASDQKLSRTASTSHRFDVYALTKHPATAAEWLTAMQTTITAVEAIDFTARRGAHLAWWSDFWNRSHIGITPTAGTADQAAPGDVTRGYALQRFITACAGRGHYPIKFNGSLFTMPWAGKPGDADYRRWGLGYWWQNTRLPYAGLCTSGDFDLMPSLFRMYLEDVLPVARYRAGHYYADPKFDDTCFMSEVTYPWGAVFSTSYGWTSPAASRPAGDGKLQSGEWHKREWVGGLELTAMMLDYFDHTGDAGFLTGDVLPAALPILRWFGKYYATGPDGKLVMNPSQALETWWTCTNPMPEVAGLQSVVARLLALPQNLLSAADRAELTALQAKLPPLPTRTVSGTSMLAAAQTYSGYHNTELPELYAVYPFRLVSFEKANAALGTAAYANAIAGDKGSNGWRQDDIFLAYLGDAAQARSRLVTRARSKDASCRFPAFWGPNFDWTPDQCHGGVLMKATQAMLLQSEGDQIFVLPAWPDDWNVDFKLRAPRQTTVEGIVRDGVLTSLTVTPPERMADVLVGPGFSNPNLASVGVEIASPSADPASLADTGMDLHLAASATVTNSGETPALLWSAVSGPAPVTFSSATSATTTARFPMEGTYVLQCMATLANGGSPVSGSDLLTVIVSPAPQTAATFRQGEGGYQHAATFIRGDNPTWNSGQRDQLLVGKLSGGQGLRGLLSYDLSSIPPALAASIHSVSLDVWTLSTSSPGTVQALELHPLLGTPSEGSGTSGSATGDGVTWNSRTGTTDWIKPGGDYTVSSEPSTVPGYVSAVDGVKTFASTAGLVAAVKAAVSSGTPLDLMMISPLTEAGPANAYSRLHSDEAADVAKRPLLTIRYGGSPNLPQVSAGTLPAATRGIAVSLDAAASNADTSEWSLRDGPDTVVFADPGTAGTSVTFGKPGVHVLRLTATNAAGRTSSDLTVDVSPNPGVYDDWSLLAWPGISDPETIGKGKDPDQDGIVNVAEWALHLDPKHPGAFKPALSRGGAVMEYIYTRRRTAPGGALFLVEWSDNLGDTWSGAGVIADPPSPIDDATESVRVTIPAPDRRRFVRLKIASP
jgi:hypothetical protein